MFNIIKRNRKRDKESYISELRRKNRIDLYGELEVFGYENGKQIYYDFGENTITVWAKHSTMHLLTGEVFGNVGTSRLTGVNDHVDSGDSYKNADGTMISGRQYFTAPTFPGTDGWWSRPPSGDSTTHLYPFFPVKMLFGTGFEWYEWDEIPTAYQTEYTNDGWNKTTFDTNIDEAGNNYSAYYDISGDSLYKTRTMNDIYSDALTGTIGDTHFAVKGAIKDSLYNNSDGDSANIELVSGNYYAKKAYSGIGHPSFIYARRETRFYQTGAEVALNWDSNVENKITYTTTIPEQTGVNAGIYYPYNGYLLKEAGLFCDARFILKNTAPSSDSESDDSGLTEFDNYSSMPYGMMFSKRYISPITKNHSVSITSRWTIYL
jgi:hypothetical protein